MQISTQQSLLRCVLLSVLSLVTCACAARDESHNTALPTGWRLPNIDEITDSACGIAAGGGARIAEDLNGDGDQDVALIAVREDETAIGVFVRLANRSDIPSWHELMRLEGKCLGIGLAAISPGEIDGIYCKGTADPCRKAHSTKTLTTTISLLIMKFASSGVIYVWNGSSKNFDRIYDSD